jgi:hypothetical protein
MWRVVVMLGLAACGRFGFDGTDPGADGPGPGSDGALGIDALAGVDGAGTGDGTQAICLMPTQHDEDGDGLDDACDPCPHLPAGQADVDMDGVGDDCDPSTTIQHRIELFDPFTGPRVEWIDAGTMMFANDQLIMDVTGGSVTHDLDCVLARDTLIYGVHTFAEGPLNHQIVLGVEASDGIYYCEFWEGSSNAIFSFTYGVNGTGTFPAIDWQSVTPNFANQSFVMTLRHTPTTMTCESTWPGTSPKTGAIPGGVGTAERVFIGTSRLEVKVDYLLQIREL